MNQVDQSPGFIHLRVHSSYSLLEGALPIKEIIKKTVEDQQPAIAITDTNNLFGALEFSQEGRSAGVQPIIGCQLDIDMQDSLEIKNSSKSSILDVSSIVLLVANYEGYKRLIDLVSRMYLMNQVERSVRICFSWLQEIGTEGLIMLTGASNGPIDKALWINNPKIAEDRLLSFKKIFGNRIYVELQRHAGYDRYRESQIVRLAYTHELPLVATNNSFFLSKEDHESHDILMAVAHSTVVSQENRPRVTPDHYLKSRSEMISLFSDLPEALESTIEIAKRCSFLLQVRKPILPRFINEKCDDIDKREVSELREKAREGLEKRLNQGSLATGYCKKDYIERLEFELDVIERMKFAGYFLIVSDFIQWAKSQNIPVGPGRGSGAGSVAAYALAITDIDPLRFSLLFERFLNPDRMSMPDFDIDFCQDRRDEVIRYVQNKYGYDKVAQIITFGSLQAKAALRDVGRALQMPYSQVDRICKLVPNNPAHPVSLRQAMAEDNRFKEAVLEDPSVDRLIEISLKLEGLHRHASTHAAGIVIADRPLSTLVPMYRDIRSDMPVTQFNMKWVEKAGLVKFDFLGLKTLTVLQKSIDLLSRRGEIVDLSKISFDDQTTYKLLTEKGTLGIFQLESSGMRQALEGMKPDCIEDIIALVSLYRPGPIDNISIYNNRKNGKQKIDSIHPLIDPILRETQGVIIYQEQVMQIAKLLSGYSLSEADVLRRAMGKKIKREMDQQRERFVSGAKKNGLSHATSVNIFELLAKFADYGFNKSHATAYAIISYRTAWMKTHYPVEFLAASMTLDIDNTDKIKRFCQDASQFNIKIIPPSVQTSGVNFETGENCIYYSLAAIKGVGVTTSHHVVEARAGKPFESLEDFCSRISPRHLNRRVLEGLICAGALDCFGYNRSQLFKSIDNIQKYAQWIEKNRTNDQANIFFSKKDIISEKISLANFSVENSIARFENELRVLGFYFSGHPLDVYKAVLEKLKIKNYEDISSTNKGDIIQLAATVMSKHQNKTRKGSNIGRITFSESKKEYEAILFPKRYSTINKKNSDNKQFLAIEDCYDHIIENRLQESEENNYFLSIEEKLHIERSKPYLLREKKSYIILISQDDSVSLERDSVRLLFANSLENKSKEILDSLQIRLQDHGPLEEIREYFANRKPKNNDGRGAIYLIFFNSQERIEIDIKLDKYPISPEIAFDLEHITGVIDVYQKMRDE
ncbi:MAG: DNA polymerase III subunit alpha [Candidatus Liberibacter europaeus]|uniref:DNA polymerase III subunit alpha n=1 Tax=Candidatus Liberibacter europaeus TaxID=744859 RepID=A0A2T4VX04_9HYPH|nr:DNA polymerase III subunit alpha [Candidatus Liberibacter europaeus]PTL86309.1 MAG: DNA polymerase III subunit alpha [Candidatus Liberibacter europaeus]